MANADDQSAHAEADATKSANDDIATAEHTRATDDAQAADQRDEAKANAHHTTVLDEARAIDGAVHSGADQAAATVDRVTNAAAAKVGPGAAAVLADFRARNDARAAELIAQHDAELLGLLVRTEKHDFDSIMAAKQKRADDQASPTSAFTWVNPTPPESAAQVALDYLPSWQTVALVAGGVVLSLLVPGGVMLVIGGTALLASGSASAADRYFNQNQSLSEALLGAGADTTGLTTLYAGLTDQDLVTGHHLGLTDAQRRQMTTEGAFQSGMTTLGAVQAGRSFGRGRVSAAKRPVIEETPPVGGAKPVAPKPVEPPPKPTTGSKVGEPVQAEEVCTGTNCFPAGTPILTPGGPVRIEELKAGDYVLSKPEDDPEAGVAPKKVQEMFTRVSPLLNLHVRGQIIRATGEHPFWVEGRGWIPARMLNIGDSLRTVDNLAIPVEGVANSGEVTTVYNMRITDYQTYFVGCEDWGFSVWVHNAPYPTDAAGRQQLANQLDAAGFKPTQVLSKMRKADIEKIAAAMTKGADAFWATVSRFKKVVLGSGGEVLDGHHRVIASVLSGKPIPESQIYRPPGPVQVPVLNWIDELPF